MSARNAAADRPAIMLALTASVLAGGLATFSLATTATDLLDPCTQYEGDAPMPASCASYAAVGSTRLRAVLTALIVPGVILAACVGGMVGVFRGSGATVLAAGIVLVVWSYPLGLSWGILVALPAGVLMVAAARRAGASRTALVALGVVAGLVLALLAFDVVSSGGRVRIVEGTVAAGLAVLTAVGLVPRRATA